MIKKYVMILLVAVIGVQSNAQFDDSVSKLKLYDDVLDMGVYAQMLAKDKLYVIKNLKKEQATKEIDYALAKINEDISEIDLEATKPQVRKNVDRIKDFMLKFDEKSTRVMDAKDFSNLYFEINVLDKLISDLSESMFVTYNLDARKVQNYKDIQELRKLIQKISVSYYAKLLDLNKSFLHDYQNNIKKINNFIADKSNAFLNDPIIGKYFPDFILDWNFLKANLQHPKYHNPKTIFSMSVSIDYHLKQIKDAYFNKLNKQN